MISIPSRRQIMLVVSENECLESNNENKNNTFDFLKYICICCIFWPANWKTYSKAHWTIAIFKQNWPNKLLHKINQRSICCSLVIPISQASLIQFVPLYKGKLFYPFLDWDQACYNVLDYWSVLKVIDQSWKMWFCNQFKCTWKRPKLLPGEGGGEGFWGKRKK